MKKTQFEHCLKLGYLFTNSAISKREKIMFVAFLGGSIPQEVSVRYQKNNVLEGEHLSLYFGGKPQAVDFIKANYEIAED